MAPKTSSRRGGGGGSLQEKWARMGYFPRWPRSRTTSFLVCHARHALARTPVRRNVLPPPQEPPTGAAGLDIAGPASIWRTSFLIPLLVAHPNPPPPPPFRFPLTLASPPPRLASPSPRLEHVGARSHHAVRAWINEPSGPRDLLATGRGSRPRLPQASHANPRPRAGGGWASRESMSSARAMCIAQLPCR